MYIATVPNRGSNPTVLLRESYREDGKVRTRTLANLTKVPADRVEAFRKILRGAEARPQLEEAFDVVRSRPHGHVAAVLGTLRSLGLDRMLGRRRSRKRDLCVAMIAARILKPQSKLATARGLGADTLDSTLGEELGVASASAEELYEALDWLLGRQGAVEKALAKRHLSEGGNVLYDVTSSYFEGHSCPLAQRGYSRDGKKGTLQIVFGLLTNDAGRPVAVEVFAGNVGDPTTLPSQLKKVREDFGVKNLVLVGDRGMITQKRIDDDLRGLEGVRWISALRAPAIRGLAERGSLERSLFDDLDLAEITDPKFPEERLVVCRNPLLAERRRRKREDLLQATERELEKIALATRRPKRRLQGQDKIGLRVGRVLGRFKMAKHFELNIQDNAFQYSRNAQRILAEKGLDGIYVIRTSVPKKELSAEEGVETYKRLAKVERAFRSFKTFNLQVRPIRHRLEKRVRAHVFLCMLAYYVELQMREKLAPILFQDEDPENAKAQRSSPVQAAERSQAALRKARKQTTPEGSTVHSFRTLMDDLATIVKDRVQPRVEGIKPFDKVTRPTELQKRALGLLGLSV